MESVIVEAALQLGYVSALYLGYVNCFLPASKTVHSHHDTCLLSSTLKLRPSHTSQTKFGIRSLPDPPFLRGSGHALTTQARPRLTNMGNLLFF